MILTDENVLSLKMMNPPLKARLWADSAFLEIL